MTPIMLLSHAFAAALTAAGSPVAPEGANAFCVTGLVVHATPTSLILQRDDGANLYIQTDGASPAQGDRAVLAGHFGLTGIRDRINRCGGEFRIESGRAGTYARLSIPL